MHLPKLTKKLAVIAGAAGLAMGASGVAFAYLSTTGSGSGSGTVGTATTVTVVTISAGSWLPGVAHKPTFKVTNPNTFKVDLTADATITSATVGTCTTPTADTALVTTAAASAPFGKVTPGLTASSTTTEPSFTVATVTHTQAGCVVSLTIHV